MIRLAPEDGPVWVSAETSRRLACDASLVVMQHRPDGSMLDVGRRRRTIPAALRRALAMRDQRCQFPGCTARRCDAHHLEHWLNGGRTSLENTTLLCRTHHRAVHEGGFAVTREPSGRLIFLRPDGAPLHSAPPIPILALDDSGPLAPTMARLRESGIAIGARACLPCDSGPLDIGWAIDVLRIPASDIDGSPRANRQ